MGWTRHLTHQAQAFLRVEVTRLVEALLLAAAFLHPYPFQDDQGRCAVGLPVQTLLVVQTGGHEHHVITIRSTLACTSSALSAGPL